MPQSGRLPMKQLIGTAGRTPWTLKSNATLL